MRDEEKQIVEFENDPVSKLLGDLRCVEAPGDFDFRVKARIAAGKPVDRWASWLPAGVRFAVPLGLLLVVGGYFGFNGLYPANNFEVPTVVTQGADIAPAILDPVDVPPTLPANNVLADLASEKAPETVAKTDPAPKEKRVVRSEPTIKKPGPGSSDTSSRISRVIGLNGVSVKKAMASIGVDANYSTSSWKVGVVKQNSRAERSGLKNGDVIEAIDGQSLTEKTTFQNTFGRKSIRILRDGKSMQIDLKP